jgi:hypothetical protein
MREDQIHSVQRSRWHVQKPRTQKQPTPQRNGLPRPTRLFESLPQNSVSSTQLIIGEEFEFEVLCMEPAPILIQREVTAQLPEFIHCRIQEDTHDSSALLLCLGVGSAEG